MPLALSATQDYAAIRHLLLSPATSAPLLPPPSHPSTQRPIPYHADATAAIAALQLHPALEVLLHILNGDLASAHFYVRHMQSPPKYEGMLLHALLHRVEGDVENARAWYGDVCGSAVFEFVWGTRTEGVQAEENQGVEPGEAKADSEAAVEPGSDDAKSKSKTLPVVSEFLDRLAKLRSTSNKDRRAAAWEAERVKLAEISEREVKQILGWCERMFGTCKWEDASTEFTGSAEKYKEMASKQLVGGEGWRQF